LGLLLLATTGCGSSAYDYGPDYSFGYSGGASQSIDQPDLSLGDEAIEAELAETAATNEIRTAAVREEIRTTTSTANLVEAAKAVRMCYRQRARDLAADVIETHPQLYAWTESGQVVEIKTNYRKHGWGGEIELTISRKAGVEGPLAVAFPPGTYGVPVHPGAVDGQEWTKPEQERRFKNWPRPQDLAMLRAPVILLEAGQAVASVTVPVSCASFDKKAPVSDQAYALQTFDAETPVDKLMIAICSGDTPPDDTDVQLALWLSRDDISWQQYQSEGGHWGRLVTFGSSSPVLPSNARGASKLMLDAGVDPRPMRFFDPAGSTRQAHELPAQAEPQTAPEEAPAPEPVEVPAVSS
jgi:hypothetical protein